MKRVLVVDDMVFMRLALKGMLEKHDYEVVGEAEDGAQAIEKYKSLKPDIVTMDITMPVKTGIEALKEIMALDPQAKVVMVSAMGQERFVKESIMNGAKYFVVKPFKEPQVLETLNKVAAL
ncbi:MAG: response regulator [Sporomusaceae bacterium]|nr:response regulator [Sporomusaceae bacterium]